MAEWKFWMPASCERTQQTLVGMGFTIWIMFTLRHQDSSNICDLIDLYPATSGSGNIYEPSGSTLVYMKKPGITRSIGELKFLNSFWRESTIPSKPNIPCKHPGCAALVPFGTKYCEKHNQWNLYLFRKFSA